VLSLNTVPHETHGVSNWMLFDVVPYKYPSDASVIPHLAEAPSASVKT
jgi:hypothetical protein